MGSNVCLLISEERTPLQRITIAARLTRLSAWMSCGTGRWSPRWTARVLYRWIDAERYITDSLRTRPDS